ncbi:MAG: DUF695 domain-containing protein, partial [Planctomycetia bacterium]
DYNMSLMDFDQDIVTAFQSESSGIPILVETFGGKRHYYFYVSSSADVDHVLNAISARYPNEKLEWKTREDSEWNFIRKYAKKYF